MRLSVVPTARGIDRNGAGTSRSGHALFRSVSLGVFQRLGVGRRGLEVLGQTEMAVALILERGDFRGQAREAHRVGGVDGRCVIPRRDDEVSVWRAFSMDVRSQTMADVRIRARSDVICPPRADSGGFRADRHVSRRLGQERSAGVSEMFKARAARPRSTTFRIGPRGSSPKGDGDGIQRRLETGAREKNCWRTVRRRGPAGARARRRGHGSQGARLRG